MIIYKCPSCGADVDPSDAVLSLAYKCKHCGTSFSFRDEKELKKIAVKVTQIKMALESRDFDEAEKICKKALDIDPENAEIYFLKLLAMNFCSSEEELQKKPVNLMKRTVHGLAYFEEYKRAYKFGNEEMKIKLAEINKEVIYLGALDWEKKGRFQAAYNSYLKILEYKDSSSRLGVCKNHIEKGDSQEFSRRRNRDHIQSNKRDSFQKSIISKALDFFKKLATKKDIGIVCLIIGVFFFVFPMAIFNFSDLPVLFIFGLLFLIIGIYIIILFPIFSTIAKIIMSIITLFGRIFKKEKS